VKPQDSDVVKLRRPLPEHDLAAGSQGTVVNDFQVEGRPLTYLVEFADADGAPHAIVHVPGDDLEVVWRPA
jgi:uncharacterized protein DUF4926